MAVSDCIRTCRNCGAEFKRTEKGQPTKFCGHECRVNAQRARDKAYPRQPRAPAGKCSVCGRMELARGLCPKHYFRQRASGSADNYCFWCGKPHDGRFMCSDECRRSAKRAVTSRQGAIRRGRIADGDKIDPVRVFERDKWRCHLCGVLTLVGKRGTKHPRAPEVEHIIALADGGTHTWGNVACACRACNGAKGARSIGQLGLAFAA
jgi:5-methylcytosine-specific restriction endonuclease McrA